MNQAINPAETADEVPTLHASQLHYTSCQFGLSGHAGFQTRAMSTDIDTNDKLALEQLAIYQPPKDLPRQPDPQTMSTSFPIAYRHVHLANGSLLITRSEYTGQDYTGRWGNYFAHGLMFDPLPANIWPIDLYEHPHWQQCLPPEEDHKQASYELPKIAVQVQKEAFDCNALQEFLQEIDQAEMKLGRMIQALFARVQTSRTLVIRDPLLGNAVFWLACLQKSFPPSLQHHLSCSSYQYDPRSCLAINVISGQTELTLGENERSFQYYVFDFVDDQYSDIDDIAPLYAQNIARWMLHEPKTLNSFHHLAALFQLQDINHSLTALMHLFLLQQQTTQDIDVEQLIAIIELINQAIRPEHLTEVVEILSPHQQLLASVKTADQLQKVIQFLLSSYQITRSASIKSMLIKQMSLLNMLCITSEEIDNRMVEALYTKIVAVEQSLVQQISTKLLADINMSLQQEAFQSLGKEQLATLASLVVDSIRRISTIPPLDSPQGADFIGMVLSKQYRQLDDVQWLYSAFADDKTAVELTYLICKTLFKLADADLLSSIQFDQAIDGLAKFFNKTFNKEKGPWFAMVNQLKPQPESWPLLQRSWYLQLDTSRNKVKFYTDYFSSVMVAQSDYREKSKIDFAKAFWHRLSPKQMVEVATIWLADGHLEWIETPLVLEIIEHANQAIGFDIQDAKSTQVASLLTPLIAQYQLTLKPNRLLLRKAISRSQPFSPDSLGLVNDALQGCDLTTYQSFLDQYLPHLFDLLNSPLQHGEIIEQLYMPTFRESLVAAYQRCLSTAPTIRTGQSCQVFLEFWLQLDQQHAFYQKCQLLEKELCLVLVAKLAKHNDRTLTQMERTFRQRGNLSQRQLRLLNQFMQQVEDKKNTLLRKIGRGSLAGAKAVATLTKSGFSKLYCKVRSRNG